MFTLERGGIVEYGASDNVTPVFKLCLCCRRKQQQIMGKVITNSLMFSQN